MTIYMIVLAPRTRVLVVVWGMDVGPLPITRLENESGFAPAMGLDGVVCKSGLD